MQSDAPDHAASAATALRPLALDFTRRVAPHELPEWMDEPASYEQLRNCLRDLAQVNRVTLAYRPTLGFVRSVAEAIRQSRSSDANDKPLQIVDVGFGGGDMLRVLERWGQQHRVPLQLTGVDLNPYAARAAREFSPGDSAIRWVTADALSYLPTSGIDLVISSLFTHHLEEAEIVQFVAWMERVARCGWFINDLRRSRRSYQLFRGLARAARWHPFVRHDGPVSIRRSFLQADWQHMLTQAGISLESCGIEPRFPGRLCVSRFK